MAVKRQPHLMRGQETKTFQRSRTLTGSVSSGVASATEARGTLQSDRLKKQSLKRHQRLLVAGLGVLLAIIGGLYYLLSQYVGSVTVAYATPQVLVRQPDTSQYEEAIIEYLGTRPGERFRFALNASELSAAVAKKYPEVESITNDGGVIGKGSFTVTFRQPIVSWKVGQKHYFVDKNGEAFEKNMYLAPSVSVRDNSGASLNQETLASKGFLRFLGRLVALADQSRLKVTEATLPPDTTRQIDIRLKGRGYLIKTHTGRDPAAIIQDIQRVISYLEQRKLTPTYIDVRVPGRAYYK